MQIALCSKRLQTHPTSKDSVPRSLCPSVLPSCQLPQNPCHSWLASWIDSVTVPGRCQNLAAWNPNQTSHSPMWTYSILRPNQLLFLPTPFPKSSLPHLGHYTCRCHCTLLPFANRSLTLHPGKNLLLDGEGLRMYDPHHLEMHKVRPKHNISQSSFADLLRVGWRWKSEVTSSKSLSKYCPCEKRWYSHKIVLLSQKRDNPDISDNLKTSLFFTTPLVPVILYFSTTLIQLYFVLTFFVYCRSLSRSVMKRRHSHDTTPRFYETFKN